MALLGRLGTTKRLPAGPTPAFDAGLRVRCPFCQAQLAAVATHPAEPAVELRVVCRCGFEISVEGPGLAFDHSRPCADQ